MSCDRGEELYWVIFNGTVHLYAVCEPLIDLGYASSGVDFFSWSIMCMERCLKLCVAKHLPWKMRLYITVCRCFESMGNWESALRAAKRAAAAADAIEEEELMDPPIPLKKQKIIDDARFQAKALSFKYAVHFLALSSAADAEGEGQAEEAIVDALAGRIKDEATTAGLAEDSAMHLVALVSTLRDPESRVLGSIVASGSSTVRRCCSVVLILSFPPQYLLGPITHSFVSFSYLLATQSAPGVAGKGSETAFSDRVRIRAVLKVIMDACKKGKADGDTGSTEGGGGNGDGTNDNDDQEANGDQTAVSALFDVIDEYPIFAQCETIKAAMSAGCFEECAKLIPSFSLRLRESIASLLLGKGSHEAASSEEAQEKKTAVPEDEEEMQIGDEARERLALGSVWNLQKPLELISLPGLAATGANAVDKEAMDKLRVMRIELALILDVLALHRPDLGASAREAALAADSFYFEQRLAKFREAECHDDSIDGATNDEQKGDATDNADADTDVVAAAAENVDNLDDEAAGAVATISGNEFSNVPITEETRERHPLEDLLGLNVEREEEEFAQVDGRDVAIGSILRLSDNLFAITSVEDCFPVGKSVTDLIIDASTVLYDPYCQAMLSHIEETEASEEIPDRLLDVAKRVLNGITTSLGYADADDVLLRAKVSLRLGILLEDGKEYRYAVQVLRSGLAAMKTARKNMAAFSLHQPNTDGDKRALSSLSISASLSERDCLEAISRPGAGAYAGAGVFCAGSQLDESTHHIMAIHADLVARLLKVELLLDESYRVVVRTDDDDDEGEVPRPHGKKKAGTAKPSTDSRADPRLFAECKRNRSWRAMLLITTVEVRGDSMSKSERRKLLQNAMVLLREEAENEDQLYDNNDLLCTF